MIDPFTAATWALRIVFQLLFLPGTIPPPASLFQERTGLTPVRKQGLRKVADGIKQQKATPYKQPRQ